MGSGPAKQSVMPKKVVVFLSGQAVFQGAMLVSGIIIVRHLDITDYALYTLANMLIGFGSVASDLGLSRALVTFGTKSLNQGVGLGYLYAAALQMRKALFVVTILILCILAYFLYRPGYWTPSAYLVVILLVITSNYVQISIQLGKSLHNINQDASTLTTAASAASLARVFLVTVVCMLGSSVAVIILVNLFAYLLELRLLGKPGLQTQTGQIRRDDIQLAKKSLYDFILPAIPNRIYFMLQSQIGLLLLSFMGVTREIAELGALGRLAMVVTFINVLNPFLVQTRLAGIDDRSAYRHTFLMVLLIVSAILGTVVFTSMYFPAVWLLLIGKKYYHLSNEVPLAVLAPSLYVLGAVVSTATMAIGNMSKQYFVAIAGLGTQLIYILLLKERFSLHDALMINIIINLAVLSTHSLLWLRAYKLHHWEPAVSRRELE